MSLRELLQDNVVEFLYYRKGYLYYTIVDQKDGQAYLFPVPIDDTGDATFNYQEKALYLMRYIRLAHKEGSFVKYYDKR